MPGVVPLRLSYSTPLRVEYAGMCFREFHLRLFILKLFGLGAPKVNPGLKYTSGVIR